MANSRSKNAFLNVYIGYFSQIITLILTFVSRKIFLHYLSIDYLGINGLYSNILSILSLAELGLDTAFLFSLYKPVAENNYPLINSLIYFFKKIYYCVAAAIFILGVCLIPFLHLIINSDLNNRELILYYLLFLINTVVSYLAAHKMAILSVYQEQRIQKLVSLCSNFLLQFLHMFILVIFKNYYLYLLANIVTTLFNNWILSVVCDKHHREIKGDREYVKFDKKPIVQRIKATFLYKLGAVAINNTDNVLISTIVSTAAVGLYANYLSITQAVQGLISIINVSLISGIGNLHACGEKKRQYEVFNILLFFYHYIAALGFIGFGLIMNDVIKIWLGKDYLMSNWTVFTIALNFYLINAVSPIWMFREAGGLFEQVKYLMFVRAALNIVFSILLGYLFGTTGILMATAVSLLLTNFWYEPRVLFRKLFDSDSQTYWVNQLRYFLLTALSGSIVYFLIRNLGDTILDVVLKIVITILIVTVSFVAAQWKSSEVHEIMGFGKRILKRGTTTDL